MTLATLYLRTSQHEQQLAAAEQAVALAEALEDRRTLAAGQERRGSALLMLGRRKAASRAYLREAAQRREEEARQQRLARWQPFRPATRSILSRVEALGGPGLAEALAEAIWSEWDHPIGKALAERYTGGQCQVSGGFLLRERQARARCCW